jgi:hypothetical protein
MFSAHPSPSLNSLFHAKPYQGANPEEAKFLFIGLDANYDAEVEDKPIFAKLQEYHEDGVTFWRNHQVHHPFLLPQYTGDGRFYHRSFSRIGFKPEHAAQVSFIELLHVPTVGRSKLVPEDLSSQHLRMLNEVVLAGAAQHIFVPQAVARLMQASGQFAWLPKRPTEQFGPLAILYRQGTKAVYSHLHFSVYGKFEERKVNEAAAIQSLFAAGG